MKSSFIEEFGKVYDGIRKKPVIKRHHQNHIEDNYAPAWKTIEFMTFGNLENLYVNLLALDDKLDICRHFGVNQTAVFENYITTVRTIRNTCAHGGVLFDMRLPKSIKDGPAGKLGRANGNNLYGVLKVVEYLLETISQNRLADMRVQIKDALNTLFSVNSLLEDTLKKSAGLLQY